MSKRPGDPGYAPGWCVNYRYQPGKRGAEQTCEAGVNYQELAGGGEGFGGRVPCYLKDDGSIRNTNAVECAHFRPPTAQEIADHEVWIKARMDMLGVVMMTIRPWRDAHRHHDFAETVDCPACKTGQLHLSIARYNGHVHGKCSTEGCVSWME